MDGSHKQFVDSLKLQVFGGRIKIDPANVAALNAQLGFDAKFAIYSEGELSWANPLDLVPLLVSYVRDLQQQLHETEEDNEALQQQIDDLKASMEASHQALGEAVVKAAASESVVREAALKVATNSLADEIAAEMALMKVANAALTDRLSARLDTIESSLGIVSASSSSSFAKLSSFMDLFKEVTHSAQGGVEAGAIEPIEQLSSESPLSEPEEITMADIDEVAEAIHAAEKRNRRKKGHAATAVNAK